LISIPTETSVIRGLVHFIDLTSASGSGVGDGAGYLNNIMGRIEPFNTTAA